MKFCQNCGAQLQEGATFCANCGSAVAQEQAQQNYAAPSTPVSTAGDVTTEKGLAILSYIIPIIPYLMKPKTEFGKFHALQGLNVWILGIIYSLAINIADNFLPGFIGAILSLGSIFFTVMYIMGIVQACQGKMEELPVIGQFKIVKN